MAEIDPAVADSDDATVVSATNDRPVSHEDGTQPIIAGRYRLTGVLGKGGMGAVYRAHDQELDELVALKMLRREAGGADVALLRREVKLARQVTHPNVARMFDIGDHNGMRFLTMELIDGGTLGALLAREGLLPVARVVALADAVVAGLEGIHAAGVVHRDLKPANVLLGRDGRVVVADFGIARTALGTGDGDGRATIVGTPQYMAPEQVEGVADLDARADLFALGVMLFEMLTGKRPWTGSTPMESALARLLTPAPDLRRVSPGLPHDLAALTMTLLERERDRRPATAALVRAALSRVVAERELPTLALSPPPPRPFVEPETTTCAVAVLPMRAGPDAEHLAAGLTEDAVDGLSGIAGLRVLPSGLVRRALERHGEALDAGRALGADVVVEASLRRAGEVLRLSARLITCEDGFQIWARRWDCRLAGVLRLGDELAAALASALASRRSHTGWVELTDPIALELYLRARHQYHRLWRDDVAQACVLFGQALARAPDDPLILGGTALALARAYAVGSAEPGSVERARRFAARAAERAPHLVDGSLALAVIELNDGALEQAAVHIRAALSLSPGSAEAHELAGRLCCELGRFEAGLRHVDVALASEPRLTVARLARARSLALLGRFDEADATVVEGLADGPTTPGLWISRARNVVLEGNATRATALAHAIAAANFPQKPIALALCATVTTRRVDPTALAAVHAIGYATTGSPRLRAWAHQVAAECHAASGNLAYALENIQRAAEQGLSDLAWLERWPALAPLRAHPAFQDVHANLSAMATRAMRAFAGP